MVPQVSIIQPLKGVIWLMKNGDDQFKHLSPTTSWS